MNAHFIASSSNLEELRDCYEEIIRVMEEKEVEVKTVYNPLTVTQKMILDRNGQAFEEFYLKWEELIKDCDIAVAEASFPSSINVGLSIATLVERGKPVVTIYREDRDPVILNGLYSSKLIRVTYKDKDDIKNVLPWAIDEATRWLNRRFTMNISNNIDMYLEEISKTRGVSRSDYIRGLIEKDMENES